MADPSATWHGSPSGYRYHACRCADCVRAHREAQRRRTGERRALLATGQAQVTHGAASTYVNWGCRCDACTSASREDHQARRARKAVS